MSADQTTIWQPIETAPKERCIKVRVRGWQEWTYATFEHGAWRDANYSPIDAIDWCEPDKPNTTVIDKIVAEAQEIAALAEVWRRDHAAYVARLVKRDGPAYPPSGSDRRRPELWKAAHWRWLEQGRENKNA